MFKRRILFSIKTFFLTKPKLNERKMTGIDYSFGKYGKVYSYGGDEFIALIYVDYKKLSQILDKFERKITEKKHSNTN